MTQPRSGPPGHSSPAPAPAGFHLTIKPAGAACDLDCSYCFYLEKHRGASPAPGPARMDEATLERAIRQHIEAQPGSVVEFAWQGGEPTLMGVEFFRRVVERQRAHAGGKRITNALQTNGVRIDAGWAEFLAENDFLVGVSIDGPKALHDRHRIDAGGRPTFDRVLAGLRTLRDHGARFNTLTTVHRHNAGSPETIYRFLRDEGSRFMQFIPIVERLAVGRGAVAAAAAAGSAGPVPAAAFAPPGTSGATATRWSVTPGQYGRFLCRTFDEWGRGDVGRVSVRIFDESLSAWLGEEPSLCILAETCGRTPVLERDGALYACDHFVYPEHRRGSVHDTTVGRMVDGEAQVGFGAAKRDGLPRQCRECRYRFACNGGCPKHRFARTDDGEPGLNYLCAAYQMFFEHADPHLEAMAATLRGAPPIDR